MPNKHIALEVKKKYAILALKWCKKNFGVSTRKRRKLEFEISERKRKMGDLVVFGVYCFYKNKITLYAPNCETLHDVVSTIIHEYSHYLQSRTKYEKYEKTYNYEKNPLEKEAVRNEKKYTKECFRYIRKTL
jgi:uncharacterized protein YjaZ